MAGNDAQNEAFLAAIRGGDGPPSEGDISTLISPDFQENPGQPMGLQNGPFLLANHGRGMPKLWENKGSLEDGWK